MENYSELENLGDGIYCIEGEWENTRFKRRMTVVQLSSGDLAIHSAIRLRDADYAWIDRLGRVKYIIIPNDFHGSEASHYQVRYPEAVLISGAEMPTVLEAELSCLELKGTRFFKERVFFHPRSKTLIVTDLVFNLQMDVYGGEKWFFKLNKIYKRFGPSRIFRYLLTKNVLDVGSSLTELLKWPIERVVMSHGTPLLKGGHLALEQSFREMGFKV